MKTVTEPIQVGEYYVASIYHDSAYLPPIMIAAGVCMAFVLRELFLCWLFYAYGTGMLHDTEIVLRPLPEVFQPK